MHRPKSIHSEYRWLSLALTIVALAFVVRLSGLGAESAWIDEAYSIALAQHSVPDLIRGTAADQHPPLYYLLLRAWLAPGGGVFQARLLAVFIGVAHVALVIGLGRRMGAPAAGAGAGALLALSPGHVWYSQEARMYVLLAALTLAATACLWRALHTQRGWPAYALLVLAALYTHYFAVFIIAAHGLATGLLGVAGRQRQSLPRWTLAILAAGLGFSPWLPVALQQARSHAMPWIGMPGLADARDTLVFLLAGARGLALDSGWRWLLVAALAGALAAVLLDRRQWCGRLWRRQAFLALMAAGPFVLIMALARVYPIFHHKQFLLLLAPLLLWLAAGWGQWPRVLAGLPFVLLALAAAWSLAHQHQTLSKDDWRAAAAHIENQYRTGDLVFGNAAAAGLPLRLYWNSPLPYAGYPPKYTIVRGGWAGERATRDSARGALEAATRGYGRVWLVEYAPGFWDPEQQLRDWLSRHGQLVEESQFRGVRVLLFALH